MTKDDNKYIKWIRKLSRSNDKDDGDDDSGIGTNEMAGHDHDISHSYLTILVQMCGDLNMEDIRQLLEQGKTAREIVDAAQDRQRKSKLVEFDLAKQRSRQQSKSAVDSPDFEPPDPTNPPRNGPENKNKPPQNGPWTIGPPKP
ncbi:MAG: hypothetical protein CMF46_00710 [Legionellales bacterium]|nr:hypothetical protein [Legionellales bacterium]|tara:strand:+ start:77 stop:508 length:432 start_codon:yes stop_codon:yes gene_type:complete